MKLPEVERILPQDVHPVDRGNPRYADARKCPLYVLLPGPSDGGIGLTVPAPFPIVLEG